MHLLLTLSQNFFPLSFLDLFKMQVVLDNNKPFCQHQGVEPWCKTCPPDSNLVCLLLYMHHDNCYVKDKVVSDSKVFGWEMDDVLLVALIYWHQIWIIRWYKAMILKMGD